jgi:integrase/recombinase XerD
MIQAILGHVKLTTTEIYTHVAITKLEQVHTATHPAALLLPPPRNGPESKVEP